MENAKSLARKRGDAARAKNDRMPEVYQVVIECKDEAEQRELFERFVAEGLRVRLLVL
jgi:hypothetical protein